MAIEDPAYANYWNGNGYPGLWTTATSTVRSSTRGQLTHFRRLGSSRCPCHRDDR